MGVFEMDNFAQGTIEVAYAIADATKKGAFFTYLVVVILLQLLINLTYKIK